MYMYCYVYVHVYTCRSIGEVPGVSHAGHCPVNLVNVQ